jgi:hypothetical protein
VGPTCQHLYRQTLCPGWLALAAPSYHARTGIKAAGFRQLPCLKPSSVVVFPSLGECRAAESFSPGAGHYRLTHVSLLMHIWVKSSSTDAAEPKPSSLHSAAPPAAAILQADVSSSRQALIEEECVL